MFKVLHENFLGIYSSMVLSALLWTTKNFSKIQGLGNSSAQQLKGQIPTLSTMHFS